MRIVGDQDAFLYEIVEPGYYLIWPRLAFQHFIGYSMYLLDDQGNMLSWIDKGMKFARDRSVFDKNGAYLYNPSSI